MAQQTKPLVHLEGFTHPTWTWLHEAFKVDGTITVGRALHLVNELKAEPDEHFPGGKWATIQHLEACIAAVGE